MTLLTKDNYEATMKKQNKDINKAKMNTPTQPQNSKEEKIC